MRLFRKALFRLGGFGTSVVLSGTVSIATIPFIVSQTGAGGWSSVAVGQSIGSLAGIFTLLGWAQSGPTRVAMCSEGRGRLFFDSLQMRLLLLLPAVLLAAGLSKLLNTSSPLATFLVASSILILNLGASWFYVGEANPRGLFVFDTLPKSAGIVSASIAVVVGASVVVYAALVVVGALSSTVLGAVDIHRRYGGISALPGFASLREISGQKHGFATALLSAAYLQAPLLVLQHFVPSAVAAYAVADKLKQQALTVYRPVSQVLQGWTPSGGKQLIKRRVRTARRLIVVAAAMGGVAFATLLPVGAAVLAESIEMPLVYAAPFAIAFAMNIASLSIGVGCLLPLQREHHVTVSAALGMALVSLSIIPGALWWGGTGAAWAVAFSQTAVASYQTIVLARALRPTKESAHV